MNNNLFFAHTSAPNVYSLQPESWDSVEQAVEMLKDGQVVLLNLEGLPPAFAQRLIDFTAGCLCALAGHQVAIGRDVFLFCPPNVKLSMVDLEESQPVLLDS